MAQATLSQMSISFGGTVRALGKGIMGHHPEARRLCVQIPSWAAGSRVNA